MKNVFRKFTKVLKQKITFFSRKLLIPRGGVGGGDGETIGG